MLARCLVCCNEVHAHTAATYHCPTCDELLAVCFEHGPGAYNRLCRLRDVHQLTCQVPADAPTS